MRGCLKPLYLPIGRKGTTSLSPSSRTEHFVWTDAVTARLEEIKALLADNPVLAVPNIGEPMLLYIAATHQVVSAVLVVKRETDGHKFPPSKAGLLCVHCPHSLQITVPALSKDRVPGIRGIPEATTLLSRVFNNSSLGSTTYRYYKQP